jgi:uncharacterized protein YcbK (DUF882 family)
MLNRRMFVTAGAASAFIILRPAVARAVPSVRKVFLANPHTGDAFHDAYWEEGEYIPEALSRIDLLMRDFHNDQVKPIDPDLIDLLARLRTRLGIAHPIQVMSGYRSPQTNAAARRRNSHVARNSYHIQGKAVDIRVPGFNLSKLRRAAIDLRGGGVGTYPKASFLHLDVGPYRVWSS